METQRVGLEMFKSLLSPDARSAHLLVFGAAFGSQAFFTFVGAPIMYSELPRQQFGNLMKKLFPTYFTYNGLAAAFLIGSLAWDNAVVRKHPFDIFDATVYQAFTLATVAAANLINALAIGPASYKLQDERHRQEAAEGKSYDDAGVSDKMQKLNKEFAGLHSISTLLNVASIGGLGFHALWLAKRGLPWSSLTRLA